MKRTKKRKRTKQRKAKHLDLELDLELLPNAQQADVLARSADVCGKIRRAVIRSRAEAEALLALLEKDNANSHVPDSLLHQAFQAFDDVDVMCALVDVFGDAVASEVITEAIDKWERWNGFSLASPESTVVDPQARYVRLAEFGPSFGALPCRKVEGRPGRVGTGHIGSVFVFNRTDRWLATVHFVA